MHHLYQMMMNAYPPLRAGAPASPSRVARRLLAALALGLASTALGAESLVEDGGFARGLMAEYGMAQSEFSCLDQLWVSESDWDHTADNPTSTAYGIPQALTGGTHDNLPADYMTNPVSQIRWGLWYIANSYGTACSAWEFKQANNWY